MTQKYAKSQLEQLVNLAKESTKNSLTAEEKTNLLKKIKEIEDSVIELVEFQEDRILSLTAEIDTILYAGEE